MRERVRGPWVVLLASVLLGCGGKRRRAARTARPDCHPRGQEADDADAVGGGRDLRDDLEAYQTFNISPRNVCKLSGIPTSALLLATIAPDVH